MPPISESRKRILVMGSAGLLESHLIDSLLDQGHETLCADNLFSSINYLHPTPRFEFVRNDAVFRGGLLGRGVSHSPHEPVFTRLAG